MLRGKFTIGEEDIWIVGINRRTAEHLLEGRSYYINHADFEQIGLTLPRIMLIGAETDEDLVRGLQRATGCDPQQIPSLGGPT